jgi:hypothetical protein
MGGCLSTPEVQDSPLILGGITEVQDVEIFQGFTPKVSLAIKIVNGSRNHLIYKGSWIREGHQVFRNVRDRIYSFEDAIGQTLDISLFLGYYILLAG